MTISARPMWSFLFWGGRSWGSCWFCSWNHLMDWLLRAAILSSEGYQVGGERGGGGGQTVIDLSGLIGYVTLARFWVETVALVFGGLRKGDMMFSVDLKDACFQIVIRLDSWPYFWFVVAGKVYQFLALWFGMSSASQVYTRIFSHVSEWTYQWGIRLLQYLDDWLVMVELHPLLLCHHDLLL